MTRLAALLLIRAAVGALLPFAQTANLAAAIFLIIPQLVGDPAETIFNIHSTTLRQTISPDAWLGRINGSIRVLEVGAVILGSLIAAWSGSHLGLRPTMWLAAALIAIGGLVCLLGSRLPERLAPEPAQA